MKIIERKYNDLKEIVNFKKDLDSKRIAYRAINSKMNPSYNMQAYKLMNKAAAIIIGLDDYINSNSTRFSDIEIEIIGMLRNKCMNVSKEYREESFNILEDTVINRLKDFSY